MEANTQKWWMLDEKAGRMSPKEVTFVPGLYKIFDEILVNAADNKRRDPVNTTCIRVDIDCDASAISVRLLTNVV
jgi:DNA topoisomerase-2